MFFRKKNDYKKQLEELEKTKQQLRVAHNQSLEASLEDINSNREFYEKMRNHGIRRFDNFLNLCLISGVTTSDISILNAKIRLSDQRLEKLLFARMLSIIIIEYLKDINELLGFKLIGELNTNKYTQFVPIMKDLNSRFANIRKENETLLTSIRNNIAAHKTKDALNLINHMFNVDPDKISRIAIDIVQLNIELTNQTTEIIYVMTAEGRENEKNSR